MDLQEVKQAIDDGMGEHELWDEYFETMVRYSRAMKEYLDVKRRSMFRKEMAIGTWIWGPTGVGKSHMAFKDFDSKTTYVHDVSTDWWDAYEGQETVIINEFRGEIKFSQLLDLTDKWPKKVKRRGREDTPFMAKKVIITSSMPPDECYQKSQGLDNIDQLMRRFEVLHVKKRCRE